MPDDGDVGHFHFIFFSVGKVGKVGYPDVQFSWSLLTIISISIRDHSITKVLLFIILQVGRSESLECYTHVLLPDGLD